MIRNYRDLTRLEMEQVNREETIVLIPLGALEQHGNQAPLGTDDIIAEAMTQYLKKELEAVDPDFPMLLFPVIPWASAQSTRISAAPSPSRPPPTTTCSMTSASAWPATDLRKLPSWSATAAMRPWSRFSAGSFGASWGFLPLFYPPAPSPIRM